MDKKAALLQLAREMQAATEQRDWAMLDALDRRVMRCLDVLLEQGGLKTEDMAALRTLHAVHARAFQLCSDEKQHLGMQLGEIHSKQEGWVAYALESDMYQDGNQA